MTLATLLGWASRDTPKCQEEAQPSQAKPHRYTTVDHLPKMQHAEYLAVHIANTQRSELS